MNKLGNLVMSFGFAAAVSLLICETGTANAGAHEKTKPQIRDLKKLIARGQALAKTHCARCHSISKNGPSPLAIAPPLRDLNKRYPVRELEEPLAEGIVTGHKGMPEFRFEPPDIGALLTFIESLSTRKPQ